MSAFLILLPAAALGLALGWTLYHAARTEYAPPERSISDAGRPWSGE